jgi:hypothetical protein
MSDAPAAASTEPATLVQAPPAPAPARRHRAITVGGMVLQVVLIAVGVFLGLAGEEWREDRENRRLADETLRRFRTEILANRAAIAKVMDYHLARLKELDAYFAAPIETRHTVQLNFQDLQPPAFEQSVWEVAVATGALSYIDADLTAAIASTYGYQRLSNELAAGVMQTMYQRPPFDGDTHFLGAVRLYYSDLAGLEPGLLEAYDALIPAIDDALQK